MNNESIPKPPLAGVLYGRICYWIVLIGIFISIIGMIIYFTSDGCIDRETLWQGIWSGADKETLWQNNCTGEDVPHGHWYFGQLGDGDALAMLGVAVCSVAAVIGMWAAFGATVREKERVYSIFALIVAVILTLGAIGIISFH